MKAHLTKADKFVFGILAPLVVYVLGSWAVGITATGEGPSLGYRGMQLLFFVFPAGFAVSGLLNLWVFFASISHRVSAFLLGLVFPVLALVLEYAFLWRIGPFAH